MTAERQNGGEAGATQARTRGPRKPKPGRSLAELRPDIAALWHPTANGEVTPRDVGYGSKQKFTWLSNTCAFPDHHWTATVEKMAKMTGKCLYCTNQRVLVGFNDLAVTHPHLVEEWDYERNGDDLPTKFVGGSNARVHWVCAEGHRWPAVIEKRAVVGVGCQKCAAARNGLTSRIPKPGRSLSEARPDLAAQLHPTANGELTASDIAVSANYDVEWLGLCGHQYEASPSRRSRGRGCPYCAGRRVLVGFNDLASQAPAAAALWHPTRNDGLTPLDVTVGSQKKAHWLCPEGHETEAVIASRAKSPSGGCGDCAVAKRGLSRSRPKAGRSLADLFPEVAAEWHPTKNWTSDPHEVHPGANREAIWLGACGHEWPDAVALRTRRATGCEICTGHAVRAGFNDLATTHPHLVLEWHPANSIQATNVAAGSHEVVEWKCSNCAREWRARIKDRAKRGDGCSRCNNVSSSASERRLFEAVGTWLELAEHGRRFDWAKFGTARISADISGTYNGRSIVIEYDGSYWHRDTAERDIKKTRAFIAAGYTVVRVREGKLGLLPTSDGLVQLQFPGVQGTDESTKAAFANLSMKVRLALDTELTGEA